MIKLNEVVAGYTFETTGGAEMERNDTVCEIISRSGTDNEILQGEPRFTVRFGDGFEMDAFASELSPWYPTE